VPIDDKAFVLTIKSRNMSTKSFKAYRVGAFSKCRNVAGIAQEFHRKTILHLKYALDVYVCIHVGGCVFMLVCIHWVDVCICI